jgi:Outer membrane protein beta-barrel domain
MKKSLFLFCLIAMKFNLLGQSFNLEIMAGPNQSTFVPPDYQSLDLGRQSGVTGFHLGAFAEFTWNKLSLQPGLVYTSIGGNDNWGDTGHGYGGGGIIKITVQYLQIPVNVLYHIPVSFGNIFLGGGPYIALGFSGKTVQTGTEGVSFSSTEQINIDNKYIFSRSDNPDYGLNGLAGIQLKDGLLFSLDYGFGLKYTFNKNSGVQNNVASLSVGYKFK